MKSVLISIQPKWCELILKGKKTVEVRKTRPKLETPFKCYVYQTKGKEKLIDIIKDGDICYGETYHGKPVFIKMREDSVYAGLFGRKQKVIGEFVCDKIEYFNSAASEFAFSVAPSDIPCTLPMSEEKALETCYQQGCLSTNDVISYFGDEDWEAYFWHISDLKIYDEPKELSEFRLTRSPQSWCYVEEVKSL